MMRTIVGRVGNAVKTVFGVVGFILISLAFAYGRQLFSYSDCAPGKPSFEIGSVIISMFGGTACEEPSSTGHS